MAPSDGGLYGLEREEPNARRGGGWVVRLRRRSRMVARLFKDSIHGSPEAALEQARAYREAVIAALPPWTNREQAVRLRRNITSGVSGVARAEPASGAVWRVTLTAKDGLRRAEFAVAEHGEDGAERLALAQRRAWLDALPPAFATADPHSDAVARCLFEAELTRAVDVHPSESLSPAEFEGRLAAVHARFDALRPPRLRVRVRSYAPGEFAVAMSDAGRPARRRLVQVRHRTSPLPQVLHAVAAAVCDLVMELYGAAVAGWFRREHLLGLLSLDRFKGYADGGFVSPASFAPSVSAPSAASEGGGGDVHLHNHVYMQGEFNGSDHIHKSAVQAAQAVLTHPSSVKFMAGALKDRQRRIG